MSVSADHFFLERAEQKKLLAILRDIPQLSGDLAVTIAKQDRLGSLVSIRQRHFGDGLIVNFTAAEAGEKLHSTLVGWVRIVCEQRAIEPPDTDTTPALSRWLRRYVIALAMTEGADTALKDIDKAYKRVVRLVCPSPEPMDPEQLDAARDYELNANGIAAAALELGEEFRNLTADRVLILRKRRHIVPVRYYRDIPVFRLDDVLKAHLAVPIRKHG